MPATLPEDQRLTEISARAFEHPADRAATAALKSIPLLDTVVRKLSELGYERAFRGSLMASSVRLGPDQLPTAWAGHVAAYSRLDLKPVPELFVTQVPFTNAAAVGAGKPFVIVNSATLQLLDEEELRTVLGHEAGHILAEHVMYRTALLILLNLSQSGPLGLVAGLPLVAVRLALLEWFRAAELSCDRAATLVNRDPMTTCRTLMVLGSGMRSEQLNVDTFVRQGSEYRDVQGWDKLARMRGELFRTHPHSVKRVHELMKWVQSGEYDRIVAGDYIRRGSEPGAREEADAATQHYAERFRGFFTDATDGVAKVGEQLTDATNKVTDWLRRDRENG
ncbi:MAG: M48 family metallopeptidase [Solirubrobacteraceae bacterium]